MAVLVFTGSSDDLVGVALFPNSGGSLVVIDRLDDVREQLAEEFNVVHKHTEFMVSVDGNEEFIVFAHYGNGGVWGFGVSQVDEDHSLPSGYSFAIRDSEVGSYSVDLVVAFHGQKVTVREIQR
jgi:hypothetical protein